MSETPKKKQALLIGINEYQILPGLKYARQDAEAVADALKQNYCFSNNEVMLLTDSRPGLFKPTNRYIIQDHLEKLANQELDLFIFGFWGHGLFRNGKRYLCPLDVMTARAERQGLPFDELQELLANIHAKNTCLILDCCQTIHDRGEAETLTASDKASMENAARDIVLRRKTQIPNFQSNVAILNSCKEGQSAYEWDARQHGLFTAHLLDAMNKRCTSVLQIASYISSNIEKTALELGKDQTPFYKLEGDIVLPVAGSTILLTPLIVLSERSKGAVIQKPVIEDIIETILPAQNKQNQPIQYKKIRPTSRSSFEWDGTKITKFIGKETEVVIPEGTTEIENWAFYGCSSLISVVIPKSVTWIGDGAFKGCRSLTSVVIPKGITEIVHYAFSGCSSLTSVVIPKSVMWIGNNAFRSCKSLTSVVIPDGVMEIGKWAFSGCSSLKTVTIPNSVTEIGDRAFAGCSTLKEWMVSASHPYFKRVGVGLLTKDEKKLVACPGATKEYHIPKCVTEIEGGAFWHCRSLTTVVIPRSVGKIGNCSFKGCSSLISVIIPEGVKKIGARTFSGCSSLTSVTIPEGVTEIGDKAFSGCSSLTSVTIPEGVRKIERCAFSGCRSLTSVVIPKGVTEIGERVFCDCSSLTSVVIPEDVTKIGSRAFYGCPVPWFSRAWWHNFGGEV